MKESRINLVQCRHLFFFCIEIIYNYSDKVFDRRFLRKISVYFVKKTFQYSSTFSTFRQPKLVHIPSGISEIRKYTVGRERREIRSAGERTRVPEFRAESS